MNKKIINTPPFITWSCKKCKKSPHVLTNPEDCEKKANYSCLKCDEKIEILSCFYFMTIGCEIADKISELNQLITYIYHCYGLNHAKMDKIYKHIELDMINYDDDNQIIFENNILENNILEDNKYIYYRYIYTYEFNNYKIHYKNKKLKELDNYLTIFRKKIKIE